MDAIEAAASANFSAVRRERTMEENKTKAKIIAGKGGVGKTSLCSASVR